MKFSELIIELARKSIFTELYSDNEGKVYVDLKTGAKSHLYLYEDGALKGRYDYSNKIDFSIEIDEIIRNLCFEVRDAMHGRDYVSSNWADAFEKYI